MLPAVSDHLFVKEYLVSLSYSNHKKNQTNGHDDRYFKKKNGKERSGRKWHTIDAFGMPAIIQPMIRFRPRQSRCLTEPRLQLILVLYVSEVFLFLFGVV